MLFKELNETRDQLDISILSADKVIKTKSDIENLLNTEVTIEHKTDGTKLTVIHVADNGDISDWIIAYKNGILYKEEYEYQDVKEIIKKSIGTSQYKLVFEHFKKLGKTGLPINYEFAIEFLQRKPTLSSNYLNPHHLVLIGYSKCNYKVDFGLLKTDSKKMETELRDEYAEILKIDVPNKLFKGYLKDFENGIISTNLNKVYRENFERFETDDPELLWKAICDTLLEVESVYGGKEEGVVIKYNNKIIKVQQSYQLDKKARRAIKSQYQSDEESERIYWDSVFKMAKDFANQCNTGTLEMRMLKLSELLKTTDISITHSKKNDLQIQDDIHSKAKFMIIKNIEGNNGCIVLGKFRVLTNGHCNVINSALKEYDRVLVCVVSSNLTKDTLQLRKNMLLQTFGNKITIIDSSSGFIKSIVSKSPFNINTVYCGTDRKANYEEQLKNVAGLNVKEYKRDSNAISATKVIANLNDFEFFKANTPKEIHNLYDQIRIAYSVSEGFYEFGVPFSKFFESDLEEDGEAPSASGDSASVSATAGGTCTADIANVTMPLGFGMFRRKKKDDYLQEMSLTKDSKTIRVPLILERRIRKVFEPCLTESVVTDRIESILTETLNEQFKFDGFKCFKSVLQFSSETMCFKIFQGN